MNEGGRGREGGRGKEAGRGKEGGRDRSRAGSRRRQVSAGGMGGAEEGEETLKQVVPRVIGLRSMLSKCPPPPPALVPHKEI